MNKKQDFVFAREKGFTLIEMLVVIFIISILATIVIVSIQKASADARDARRLADVKTLQTAVEAYANRYNTYKIGSFGIGWLDYNYTPGATDPNNGLVDNGNIMTALINAGFMNSRLLSPSDTTGTGCYSYMYYQNGSQYAIYARTEGRPISNEMLTLYNNRTGTYGQDYWPASTALNCGDYNNFYGKNYKIGNGL